ncbi:single-stranded-DNA-specific exonuclease RecJ [Patescibacteria group bacterium]|nr:single-stranded-DNA-specific exonuclease RecJ [Patescibacteria group bacterium]MBU1519568.1 single-stranded-DNA-specific exonuclease RecJ [Patescibacteria group bacterium]MBU2010147.1 single-stranded-DNA-specific exonuclease RecJ [Patescibacteria group bacterium]MBU2417043.1 single-stranded-DNA-specific exonuclease RecJ [Patescibacteria group bacterium]MBU2460609.1 single-stranded-DNA-specific exonuclease RecJ [Patescibacteria group bacterium]
MPNYKTRENVSEDIQKEMAEYPPLLQKLLFYRGIKTKAVAEQFLNPDWDRDHYDPFLILNMKKAVSRILEAIKQNEKIVIYGDFDCDGVPGSVLLHDFFKKINYKNFSNYIPHRHNEGYGFHILAIEQFVQDGANLIITVDVGITDIEAVEVAQKKGIDVIITDHHLPNEEKGKEVLPRAYAILNSKQQKDTYPDDMLSGTGVVFKLVQALLCEGRKQKIFKEISIGWEKWLLDMAGLATLADMVPLQKENRALAYFGLKVLQKSRRKGLRVLLKKMKIDQKTLSEDDVTFMIAPRVNAASRIDHSIKAFELLTTDDDAEAETLADHLENINQKRKGYVAAMVKDAKQRLKKRDLREVIVIGSPDWKPSLLGLIASSLAEEYSCPAFVWGCDIDQNIKGSCRSGNSVSVLELMKGLPKENLSQFGGHQKAGGFSIMRDNIHTLEEALSKAYKKIKETSGEQIIFIDHEFSLDDVSRQTNQIIEQLAPFGVGNEKPKFLFNNIEVNTVSQFGKQKNHLRLDFFNSAGKKISAIGFFINESSFEGIALEAGQKINLVATIEKAFFRGFAEIRLRIVDILPM